MTAQVDGPYCAIHDAAHRPCDPRDPLDAGVLSSDAPIVLSPVDADRVAAMIEERPGPTEAMLALFAERRPCAGWVHEDGRWSLRCGSLVAMAYDPRPGREVQGWAVEVYRLGSANHGAQADGGYVATHDEAGPARIAAEDALRAVAAEILRAVGA